MPRAACASSYPTIACIPPYSTPACKRSADHAGVDDLAGRERRALRAGEDRARLRFHAAPPIRAFATPASREFGASGDQGRHRDPGRDRQPLVDVQGFVVPRNRSGSQAGMRGTLYEYQWKLSPRAGATLARRGLRTPPVAGGAGPRHARGKARLLRQRFDRKRFQSEFHRAVARDRGRLHRARTASAGLDAGIACSRDAGRRSLPIDWALRRNITVGSADAEGAVSGRDGFDERSAQPLEGGVGRVPGMSSRTDASARVVARTCRACCGARSIRST